MIGKTAEGNFIISAVEVASFVVCPEAWRLKSIEKTKVLPCNSSKQGSLLHQEWADRYGNAVDLLWQIRLVTCLILTMILLFICIHDTFLSNNQIANFEIELLILLAIVITGASVLKNTALFAWRKKSESGISTKSTTVGIEGHESLPVKNYVSTEQGLAGRPDALIQEGSFLIPVERKPLAKKIRDRHVAQLLVYLRLIEEAEGKRPPYGYLLLGPRCRRVKVHNSRQKQAWLEDKINAMRTILKGARATPAPQPSKCAKCPVRHACAFKA